MSIDTLERMAATVDRGREINRKLRALKEYEREILDGGAVGFFITPRKANSSMFMDNTIVGTLARRAATAAITQLQEELEAELETLTYGPQGVPIDDDPGSAVPLVTVGEGDRV